MTDPWILGALVLISAPFWIPLFLMFGGVALAFYGIGVGGPLGALCVIVGTVWFVVVLFGGDPDSR